MVKKFLKITVIVNVTFTDFSVVPQNISKFETMVKCSYCVKFSDASHTIFK